ncbi:ribosome maturation factor RimM [Nodosilinea sp. LEGE 07298]|jgi:16S rRNA processing protein RimM|uniref:ribosome maturation factor RimM n=1 Tax=Nodosilinea sp. LEGE 07298 TaxID=2777970 RepID=UPI001882C38F|nr:ribosome maturation factor RimM [Nodosilinea sp. LEGE 07298]MBE9112438.1 ribosome maturation factor RimM [Nodosilinea sp. LEGE 07298]
MAANTVTTDDWVEIGRIVAPQGVKGEVRVYPSSDFPERFLEPGDRWLKRPRSLTPERVELVRGRYIDGKGLYVVQIAGVDSREEAEALRDAVLMVAAGDRPTLAPEEFYVADLVGLRVIVQATRAEIGTVTDIFAAGNDLLEVTYYSPDGENSLNSKPRTVLVPFVTAIVPVVNLAQGYVEINPPTGLLDP